MILCNIFNYLGLSLRKLVGFVSAAYLACLCTPAEASRLLIRKAMVIDGTGAAAKRADVRIGDGQIIVIGNLKSKKGEQVIDAKGLILSPGFIDTHSHHDWGLDKERGALSAVSQGITTIVVGQDGSSELQLGNLLKRFEDTPAAVNIASYIGFGTVRGAVMGRNFNRKATPAEVWKMRDLVATAMKEGALGLSSGLEYDPDIYADKSEVIALTREAAAYGGRYITHMRSEDYDIWAALDEAIDIGRQAKIPVQISHMKLAMVDFWGQANRFIAIMEKARTEGIDVTGDVYPYEYWNSALTVLWPKRDFENRKQAEFVLKSLAPPDGIFITSFAADKNVVGKTIAQIATERKTDAATVVMDLIRQGGSNQEGSPNVIGTSMDAKDIAKLIIWPHANIASDGTLDGGHPRGAGAFTRVLRVHVREKNILSIEQAVHRMTGLSAKHMGLLNRGVIRPGAVADLVLFDPKTVGDRATIENPKALSTGIAKVWVSGKLIFDGKNITGAFPGKAIYGPGTHKDTNRSN
jgi:N-acyl-D-amino-acid deacylase